MTYQDALMGRVSLPQQIYHLTVCTYQREPLFSQLQTGRLIVHEFKYLQETQSANSLAWVVMPDHVHWLMQLAETNSLATVLKRFKGRSTHAVNNYLHPAGHSGKKDFMSMQYDKRKILRK